MNTVSEDVGYLQKRGQREGSWGTSHLTGRLGSGKWTCVLGHMIRDRWQGLAFLHAAGLQAHHPLALIRILECSVASVCVIRPYSNICSKVNDFIMPAKE